MNKRPSTYSDVETCVDDILTKVGRRIKLGSPPGLGKANHLVNEFFRRALKTRILNFTFLPLCRLPRLLGKVILSGGF